MSTPRVAVGPQPADWATAAVQAGGGRVVDVPEAEAMIWLSPHDADGLLAALAGRAAIRWVQLPFAGVEAFAAKGVFADGRVWTCAKGIYAPQVAEMALALALAGRRRIVAAARARSWGRPSGRSLFGAQVAIVGGGGIATSLIGLLRPFGAVTTVVRRRPTPVQGATRTVGADKLAEALAPADVVVLALALTPDTTGIIGAPELDCMQPTAWLVNVARGAHVKTDDLVRALREETVGGAALDVTDPEPLPDGHPLWDMPNCVITPHAANPPAMAVAPLGALITDNVARFAAGEELTGRVDPGAGY